MTVVWSAQIMVQIAETSRFPMVAAWDHLLPSRFTWLHPRYGTPTRSLAVVVTIALVFGAIAPSGAGAEEAFQLLNTSSYIFYGVNYLLMFSVPLLLGTRFSRRPDLKPPRLLRIGCAFGATITLMSIVFNLVPIV